MNDINGIKILYIEDDPDDILIMEETLVSCMPEADLICAYTLKEGLSILGEISIDIILLDLGLPDSNGLDSLRKISFKSPHLPVIVFTGYEDENTGIEAIVSGAQDYLIKNSNYSDLFRRIIINAIQRKRIELKLLLTKTAIDNAADEIFWIRKNGSFGYVNAQACNALEYTESELSHMCLKDIDPLHNQLKFKYLWHSLKTQSSMDTIGKHITKSGRVYAVESRLTYFDFAGKEYIFAYARELEDFG